MRAEGPKAADNVNVLVLASAVRARPWARPCSLDGGGSAPFFHAPCAFARFCTVFRSRAFRSSCWPRRVEEVEEIGRHHRDARNMTAPPGRFGFACSFAARFSPRFSSFRFLTALRLLCFASSAFFFAARGAVTRRPGRRRRRSSTCARAPLRRSAPPWRCSPLAAARRPLAAHARRGGRPRRPTTTAPPRATCFKLGAAATCGFSGGAGDAIGSTACAVAPSLAAGNCTRRSPRKNCRRCTSAPSSPLISAR